MECLFNQGISEILLQSLINYTEIQGGSSYKWQLPKYSSPFIRDVYTENKSFLFKATKTLFNANELYKVPKCETKLFYE